MLKKFCAPRYWAIWIMAGSLRLIGILPLPAIAMIGKSLGEITYRLHRKRAHITRCNLRACFPNMDEVQVKKMAREHFHMMMTAVLMTGIGWWGSADKIKRLTNFRNREVVDDARARGVPIILLTPHMAAVEYGGIYLSLNFPVVSMHQPNKNNLLDTLINRYRTRFGGIQFERRDFSKSMFRLIKNGHAFYYAPDQDSGRRNLLQNKSVFAPFFGVPAATFTTLSRLTKLTGACVIPCITRITKGACDLEVVFGEPLKNYPSGDAIVDATNMNRAIEKMIEYAPAQYFWSHRRFNTRPEGQPAFYKRK